eukprot:CAMPEP_0196731116 /NCGR_PEP_ID=MMETSP1091-20130531/10975_1 /TAXON_ID=302021 /ORGANISM="Rhodomonas sp., Strain CCMP768" /LENGTH=40 /DNA_ID= /DNA_START= /DNA_END= /DNA_ORIENTATION=
MALFSSVSVAGDVQQEVSLRCKNLLHGNEHDGGVVAEEPT